MARKSRTNPALRRELQAHLDALHELGPQYTDAVAISFMVSIWSRAISRSLSL